MAFLLVSACLVGFQCRYDGKPRVHQGVLKVLEGCSWIAVCPEQRAGFPTPRKSIMFEGGTGEDVLKGQAKIIRLDGKELTKPLMQASRSLSRMVNWYGIKVGILKERSPSCGVNQVYIGETVATGMGLFTAMLRREDVEVFSEETLDPAKLEEFL